MMFPGSYKSYLCENKAGLIVNLEDLLYRIDISSSTQVKSQIVFHRGIHNALQIIISHVVIEESLKEHESVL